MTNKTKESINSLILAGLLSITLTGDIKKIDAFISLLDGFGIKKISRTGLTAMARGI